MRRVRAVRGIFIRCFIVNQNLELGTRRGVAELPVFSFYLNDDLFFVLQHAQNEAQTERTK